jgi:hypothetical protein
MTGGTRRSPEWQSVVRQVMDQVEQGDAPRPRPVRSPRWQTTALALLSSLFVAVGAWNVAWLQGTRSPAFTQAQVEESLRATIFLAVVGLEAHRSRTGAYPPDLAAVGLDDPALEYRREGDHFVLVGALPGVEPPPTFRSGDDLAPFELALDRAFPGQLRGGA